MVEPLILRTALVAASWAADTPPSATNRASDASAVAADGRRIDIQGASVLEVREAEDPTAYPTVTRSFRQAVRLPARSTARTSTR